MTQNTEIEAFIEWFQSNGGYYDTQAMGITEFPGSGRGAIALRDIPEGYTLFSLPRALTLSTRTSPLPSLFGLESWRVHGLHKGWVGLILCMMWEDAWANELDTMNGAPGSTDMHLKWGPYIRTLPTTFNTPMFWSAEELEELQGTAVTDKIGRDDAERAYSEQLVPAIKTSPTLFPPSHHEKWYTLDAYHRAGSRILSRSFTVSRWTNPEAEENGIHDGEDEGDGDDVDRADGLELGASFESHANLDDVLPSSPERTNEEMDSDTDDDADNDPSDIAMVPMADILNARWGSENAKLFCEPALLRMVTTKSVQRGEQIFNTYGDPPKSVLLRRYGHVDMVRLPACPSTPTPAEHDLGRDEGGIDTETVKSLGNPSDVVEIRADLVVDVVRTAHSGSRTKDPHSRIEWWVDEGEDDVFVLSLPEPGSHLFMNLAPGLISLIRLLTLSESDYESTRSKGKLPKGKLKKTSSRDNKEVLEILDEVLKQRERIFAGGNVEDDEHLLSITQTLTERKRLAVIVRVGEKRILRCLRQMIGTMLAELCSNCGDAHRNKTDHTSDGRQETGSGRKRVESGLEGDRGYKKARK